MIINSNPVFAECIVTVVKKSHFKTNLWVIPLYSEQLPSLYRHTKVHLICSNHNSEHTDITTDGDDGHAGDYVFNLTTPFACPGWQRHKPHHASIIGPIGIGIIFLYENTNFSRVLTCVFYKMVCCSIILSLCSGLLCFILYFIIGGLIMKFKMQATGTDIIPQKRFWFGLPLLIKVCLKAINSFSLIVLIMYLASLIWFNLWHFDLMTPWWILPTCNPTGMLIYIIPAVAYKCQIFFSLMSYNWIQYILYPYLYSTVQYNWIQYYMDLHDEQLIAIRKGHISCTMEFSLSIIQYDYNNYHCISQSGIISPIFFSYPF